MLSVLTASVILGVTLFLFLATVLIPIRGKISKFLIPPDDHFISSRNTQSWISIGFSLYAGAVGTWALTAPPETAVTGGWWALLGYSVGCGLPWILYLWSGVKLRRLMQYRGFTSLEFVYERYGRPMHIIVSFISIVYLVGMLISELTAIGTFIVAVSPGFPPLAATLSVSLVTNFYSALGGFPASMLTDKLQGVLTVLLVIICYGAVFGAVNPNLDAASWAFANSWETEGIITALILMVSCFIVEQLNQSSWQRVFAARSDYDLYWGFCLGVSLMFPSMLLFGFAGVVAKAADHAGYISLNPEAAYEAMFLLLAKLPDIWLGVVVFMVIGLVTSTADTIQTGLAATITGELTNRQLSLNWARIFSLALNVPAVLLAAFNPPSILAVMMAVNILTVAIVPAILLGFSERVTSVGAVSGVGIALLSIHLQGWIFTGSFVEALQWATFPHGFNWECLVTFLVVVFLSTICTLTISQLDMYIYKEKRQLQKDLMEEIKRRNAEAACLVEEGGMPQKCGKPAS